TNVNDTIDTTTVHLTSDVTTVAEGGAIIYTATVANKVTGSDVIVTLADNKIITIKVGDTTGTLTETVVNNGLAAHADVTNAITTVSGGNYENLVADTTPITTTVTNTPADTHLVLSAPTDVNEGGSIVYTATVDHAAGTDLTITLSNNQTITILAGHTTGTSAPFAVQPNDVYLDATKISQTVTSVSGGNFDNLVLPTAPTTTNVNDTIDTT
ncbi:immunoglobulin-like domain-containing protein, partial [Pseudomonas sp. UMAB-08]|uniref:immunoglobulin-like domain-containing protein n=1 Tax=Pseudomonas sp. UMAB-08 TaxID=1365375 RepID=UPI0035A5FF69